MTIRTRVRANGETSIRKSVGELDTTVSKSKGSLQPSSNDGFQLDKKNPSKKKSSRSSKSTQPTFIKYEVLSWIGLSICIAIFAYVVHEEFYIIQSKQTQSHSARAIPGPITVTIEEPGTYTWSHKIEQPGIYTWSDGRITTHKTETKTVCAAHCHRTTNLPQ